MGKCDRRGLSRYYKDTEKNELLTPKEFTASLIPPEWADAVNISKHDIYWIGGKRFCNQYKDRHTARIDADYPYCELGCKDLRVFKRPKQTDWSNNSAWEKGW